ncbi:MAG TPA: ABC transporter permease [Candidatus Hydrogenedentes bacterium]|nr:ABC transporter permease [Candidatus Hydrogenedentota bacterium]
MRHLAAVIRDEYLAVLRNPGTLLIFLGGLLVYSMVYPLPYTNQVIREVPVVPVDLDHSALSRRLLRWADATEEVRLAAPAADPAGARDRVLLEGAGGVLVIPEGFERAVLRGEQATVSVYADATWFLAYRQVVSGLYKAAATLSAGVEIRRLTAADFGERHALKARETLRVEARPLFNPSGGYAYYVVPAVLVLVMQQTLLIGVAVMGGARREGHVAPAAGASALAVLVGRAFAYVTWYSFYPLFYLTVVYGVYGFPSPGDPFEAMVFLMPFLIAAAMLGITLAGLFRTPDDAIPALLFMSVPVVFLMGFAWPLETLPVGLRWLAMLLPATPGALGFVRINQLGASLAEVSGLWFLLWGLAAAYAVPAWFAVRGELARAAATPDREEAAESGAPPQTHETPGAPESQI